MHRALAFMPVQMTDQHVLAVYFDKGGKVSRIANYGMQDGKVFDYVSPHHANRRPGARLPAQHHGRLVQIHIEAFGAAEGFIWGRTGRDRLPTTFVKQLYSAACVVISPCPCTGLGSAGDT